MKQKIRLTESQLHRIIKESVRKVLNEEIGNVRIDNKNALRGLFNISMLSISEFDSEDNIKAKIAELMKMYGNHVVTNEREATKFLEYAEIDKPLQESDVADCTLSVPTLGRYFHLNITAYYYDSGSDDYCYSIYLSEEDNNINEAQQSLY